MKAFSYMHVRLKAPYRLRRIKKYQARNENYRPQDANYVKKQPQRRGLRNH